MIISYPAYYEAFHCIAGACPDSCCKEWAVDVDADTAAFYRGLTGPLGDRLRQVLTDTESGTVMKIENSRCPMWRQDGLCRIQVELGHDALCQTCQQFPRLYHDYGSFAEWGLELSCPEAARLILSSPVHWVSVEVSGGEEPDYEEAVMAILLESRKVALEFLCTTSLPPNQALAVLLLYAHEVQSWLDGGTSATLDSPVCLELAQKYAATGNWQQFTVFFAELEILTLQWQARLAAPAHDGSWHRGHLALAQYFITRYWLQAVSDYDLICRAKLAVTACLLTYHLGGDFMSTAQLLSKELENDPDNLDAILDGAYTSPALTDMQLLSLLLNG